ncbi:MAG: hypothetical protein KJO51_08050, partial [Gramella sp.]|nr:hypothetical protein [Christiangramia sp.]
GSPSNWDFHSKAKYETRILKEDSPISLFNPATDSDNMVIGWSPKNNLIPVSENEAEFQVSRDSLFKEDVENTEAEPIYDYSFRYNFLKKIANRELEGKDKIIIKARALENRSEKLQVALVMNNGASFGKTIELTNEVQEIEIDITDLKPVKTVTLPRPYPGFLPYYFDHSYSGEFKIEDIEAIQFSIGPGIEQENLQKQHAIGIREVSLE